MRAKVLVERCSTGEQEMDIKRVPSFHMTAGEKCFTFLEQEVICAWREDRFFGSAGNDLLNDLGLQDISADSTKIDAEEGLLIGDDPLLDEVRAIYVFAEFELSKAEGLGNWLNARTNGSLDFFGLWNL